MYLYVESLKQRIDAINQLRINRALAAMNPSFQLVYTLLPILLHYHHPLIPGYIDGDVPHGVCFFKLNKIQLLYLRKMDFHWNIPKIESPRSELPIIGIYTMGSTSSVGQSYHSDLDIWVCHQTWLNNKERQLLQCKCDLLEKWSASFGIEINFFLIDENHFRKKEEYNINSKYHNSTQQVLLLDEFYRTAVRLSGKRILWNIVPEDKEEYYDEYVMTLYAEGVLAPNEWLDFGKLNSVLAEDYFGAGLWQLYKIANSPYKTLLKTLLIEAYSWEYPNSRLLAKDIKQRLHNGNIASFGLDPYCMMLERVTEYLKNIDDSTRIDLVRRCFYHKVCENLSRNHIRVNWHYKVVSQMVKKWGWNEARLVMLDSYNGWKIDQFYETYRELLDAMIQSYHNLIKFVHSKNLKVSINLQNINLLLSK